MIKKPQDLKPEEFIMPLNMNGLQGRMMRLPSTGTKAREILFVYGHHSSLERWWPLILELSKYGSVTAPDLPGFGGMESLYKIGEKPTLNRYADYLASLIKLRYRNRRLTVIGTGFGFLVVTRMLQRYPDIAKRVNLAVSLGGFSRFDDIVLKREKLQKYRLAVTILGLRPVALAIRKIYLRPKNLKKIYASEDKQYILLRRFEASVFDAPPEIAAELWASCDLRTHIATVGTMLKVDNCQSRVPVPAWHVEVPGHKFLNEHSVEQHLRVIFEDFHNAVAKVDATQPITDYHMASRLLPPKLKRALSKA